MQLVLEAWADLVSAEQKLSQFAETLDMPRQRLFRAEVRVAAVEAEKLRKLLESLLHEDSGSGS